MLQQHEIDRSVALYAERQPSLVAASASFVELVTSIIDDAGINYLSVTGRAKGVASFAGKVHRLAAKREEAFEPLTVITDQVGLRVITYVEGDVLAVADLLRQQFTVLEERDLGKETASEGRFGYASRHLLVSRDAGAGAAYDPPVCASIQLRTVLQHAWAEFEHDVRYKGTVPPEQVPDLDRRFTLAAGLLELADREFSTIRDRIQAGLSERVVEPDTTDPRISARELATFLAGRYASAGWSRTEQYEWIGGLLLEVGIDSLEELSAALRQVDTERVTAGMGYKYPPGAVRRLDDDLLAALGERYLDLPSNNRRREALAGRLARLARLAEPSG